MKYLEVFTLTIKQWWNHKYLWIVGILGTILTAGSGGSYSPSSPNSSSSSQASFQRGLNTVTDFLNDPANLMLILMVSAVVISFSLILFVLGLYLEARADSALYQATEKIGQNDEKIGFWKTWSLGKFRLKTLMGQKILISLPIFVAVIIVMIGGFSLLITSGAAPMNFALFMMGIFSFVCLLFIYAIIASIASAFGRRVSVFENVGAIEGIKKGINFFVQNFSHIIIFWLISLISTMVVGMVTFMVVLIGLVIGVAVVLVLVVINPIIAIVIGIIALVVFVILLSLISGPLYAFNQMYWTNVYLEIRRFKA